MFQYLFMSQMPAPPEAPDGFRHGFEIMQAGMLIVDVVFALVVAALFGRISWMLCRPHIAAECRAAARSA